MSYWTNLENAGAPDDVVEVAKSLGASWRAGWAACDRGDALLWIAGIHGMSLPHAVLAASACARLPFEGAGADAETALAVLSRIESCMHGDGTPDECAGLAVECERATDKRAGTYRAARGPRVESAWVAATWVARAAEALVSAHERFFADRVHRARGTAALLGMSIGAALPFTQAAELRLLANRLDDDPIQSELVYVVASTAEAAREAASALAAGPDAPHSIDEAHLLCAAMVREVVGTPGD